MSLGYSRNRINSDYVLSQITLPPVELTSTVEVYGDSLSDSHLENNPPFEVWSDYVCQQLGKTQIGIGVGGNKTNQMMTRIYDTRSLSSNNSALMFIGTNDFLINMSLTSNPDMIIEQISAVVLTALLYCLLPAANKFNARNSVKTGTWTNTSAFFTPYTQIGSGTVVPGSTISQQVTGRYVSFTITFLNPNHDANYVSSQFGYDITNCVINLAGDTGTFSNNTPGGYSGPLYGFSQMQSSSAGGLLQRTFILDTGKEGTHLITLTAGNPQEDQFWVDWFGGWSSSVSGNPSMVLGLPLSNYARTFQSTPTATQNDIRRTTYNELLKQTCNTLKKVFYLPATYVEPGTLPFGSVVSDGIHYNWMGHKYIGQRVIDTARGTPL